MRCILLAAVFALFGCASPPTPAPEPPPPDLLSGRVWVSADEGTPIGEMRIFLADGTLVMDSCWETYRLSTWERDGEERIRWEEDGQPIGAKILTLNETELRLELALVSSIVEKRYRAAEVPFVCPDMPR